MARLIDADALMASKEKVLIMGRNAGRTMAMLETIIKQLVECAPTVDAVKVVRCKNCMCSFEHGGERLCSQLYEKSVHDDDFCSFGEVSIGGGGMTNDRGRRCK